MPAMPVADGEREDFLLGEVINGVADDLERAQVWFGHGTDNAWDEACWLVSAALGLDPLESPVVTSKVSDLQRREVARWQTRRIDERMPVAYLTGEAWFAGLKFEVNPHVLIPRSPIAELILERLPLWPLAAGDRVLDLCAGCGCIAVALAVAFPDVHVVASDLSAEAAKVLKRNVSAHEVSDRCDVVRGDLFEPVDGMFKLIISNPPYVSQLEYQQLPAEYLHEPGMALHCDGDGLDLPLKILHDAPDYLTPDGHLILETGNSAAALEQALTGIALTWLSFAHGGGGILTASCQELSQWRPILANALKATADVQ